MDVSGVLELLLVLAVIGGFFGGGIWYGKIREREVRTAFQALAAAQEWSYADSDPAVPGRWPGAPFRADGSAAHVLTGSYRGRPCTAFEYSYEAGSGDDSQTVVHLVAVLRLPALLPKLQIEPEGWFTRVLGLARDIRIGHDRFDSLVKVQSPDERFARAFLQPPVVDWLMYHGGGFAWRIEGDELITWEVNQGRVPARLVLMLDRATELLGLVPDSVWREHAITA